MGYTVKPVLVSWGPLLFPPAVDPSSPEEKPEAGRLSLLVGSILLGLVGVIEMKAVLFLIIIFAFTSGIAVFSERYRNK